MKNYLKLFFTFFSTIVASQKYKSLFFFKRMFYFFNIKQEIKKYISINKETFLIQFYLTTTYPKLVKIDEGYSRPFHYQLYFYCQL